MLALASALPEGSRNRCTRRIRFEIFCNRKQGIVSRQNEMKRVAAALMATACLLAVCAPVNMLTSYAGNARIAFSPIPPPQWAVRSASI